MSPTKSTRALPPGEGAARTTDACDHSSPPAGSLVQRGDPTAYTKPGALAPAVSVSVSVALKTAV